MRLTYCRDAGGDIAAIERELAAPEHGPGIPVVGFDRRVDPRLERCRLVEHVKRVSCLGNHLAAIGQQIARHKGAVGRRTTDKATVGEVDLQHLWRVERQKQTVCRQDAAAARAAMIRGQRLLPDNATGGYIEGFHAPPADNEGSAIDDSGHAEPVFSREPPRGGAPPQIEAEQFLRLSWSQQHAATGQDRRRVEPMPHRAFTASVRTESSANGTVSRHADAVGKHRHPGLPWLGIFMRPEQRAGCQIDRDHGSGARWTDEHAFGERGREASEPPRMAVTIVDRPLLVDFGEWLRPFEATGGGIDDVEPDFPLLLDEHEQLLAHGQRCPEVPIGGDDRQPSRFGSTTASRESPPQRSTVGDIVGRERVAPPPAAALKACSRSLESGAEVDTSGLPHGHGVGMALHDEYQPTIACQNAAGGILEGTLKRTSCVGIGRIDPALTPRSLNPRSRCLRRRRVRSGL